MTADILDIGIVILIALSAVIGLVRGFVREAISLVTWLAAFAFALLYVKPLAAQLPFALQNEVVRLGIAFALIFFGALVVGAIINYLFTTAVASIGLGGVDHFFGGLFGAARGALIVTLAVVLIGLTTIPSQPWWKGSRLLPWFTQSADWLKTLIPEDLSSFWEKGGGMMQAPTPVPTPPAPTRQANPPS